MTISSESINQNFGFPLKDCSIIVEEVTAEKLIESVLRPLRLGKYRFLIASNQIRTYFKKMSIHPERKLLYSILVYQLILLERRNKRKKRTYNE